MKKKNLKFRNLLMKILLDQSSTKRTILHSMFQQGKVFVQRVKLRQRESLNTSCQQEQTRKYFPKRERG